MLDSIQNYTAIITGGVYVLGLFTPYLQNRLDRILNSDKYKFIAKVYDRIDPELLTLIKGQVPFVELIEESIESISDKELTMGEVQKLTQLVIRDFNMVKALRKNPSV